MRGDAGIEPCMWRDHAQAVRAKDAQAMRARGRLHLCPWRARAFSQVRGEDDRGLHATFGSGAYHLRHDGGRCGDHHQFRHPVQVLQPLHRADAIDLGMARVDPCHFAGEAGAAQVAHHCAARRALTRAAADHRDRLRTEHGLQVVGTHVPTVPKFRGDGVRSLSTGKGSDPCAPTKVGTCQSMLVLGSEPFAKRGDPTPAYSSVPCRIIAAMLK